MSEVWILSYLIVTVTWTGHVKYEPAQVETSSYEVCMATKEDMSEVYVGEEDETYRKYVVLSCGRK